MHIDLYECEPQLSKSQLVDITIVKSCMGPIHVFLIFDTPYLFALINLKFNSRYFFRIFTIMAWQHIFLGQYHILSFVDLIFNRSLTWIPLHLRVSIFLFLRNIWEWVLKNMLNVFKSEIFYTHWSRKVINYKKKKRQVFSSKRGQQAQIKKKISCTFKRPKYSIYNYVLFFLRSDYSDTPNY